MRLLPRITPAFRLSGLFLGLVLLAFGMPRGHAADHATEHAAPAATASKPAAKTSGASAANGREEAPLIDLKAALREKMIGKKSVTLVISDKPESKTATASAHGAPAKAAPSHEPEPAAAKAVPESHAAAVKHSTPVANPRASHDYIKAKAAALAGHETAPESPAAHVSEGHGGEVHWSYEGETGPQNWGKLKPEFNVCAIGKRQSPINIEESATLQGPAEPLQFNYTPSSGTVVNNGHTIQVDLSGDNSLTVRGSTYRLLQFHFHTPSEEQVNYRNSAMVAHLVHKNNEGQLAVVAVLLDPGVANELISKVWTYMPLDTNDRVRIPLGIIDMNELLPKDQRYFQFIGSLTTPPCTEGVLWIVMKQPTQLGREQIRLFQQLFPNNARPVQPVNGRPVRQAQ
jgi:carbonic anhydrase